MAIAFIYRKPSLRGSAFEGTATRQSTGSKRSMLSLDNILLHGRIGQG